MNDQAIPSHRTRRISLTKAELRTELGAGLLPLCESVTADGKLAPEEAEGLREWLDEADAAELPAASYLREVVERVLADGQITPEECREVYRAVEVVLPPEVRRQATAARKEIEATQREEVKAAREQEREERRRDTQIAAIDAAGSRSPCSSTTASRSASCQRKMRNASRRFSTRARSAPHG